MPIVWRFLISQFMKTTFACVLAFIAILLTMRFDEIAHFAALGAPVHYLLFFTLYQVPYILPIALPLSCLIAALLLIKRFSDTHELTALRACGLSLMNIFSPIFLCAAFLALANFWITSELATQSHLQSNLLKSELRSINPLFLLHNKHLMRLKGFYFDSLGPTRVGESAADVVIAIPNKHQERIQLMLGKHLKAKPEQFIGQQITLITSGGHAADEDYDNLLIENMRESVTSIQDFSPLLQKKVWSINNDYLKLPLLLFRIQDQRRGLAFSKQNGASSEVIKTQKIDLNRSMTEITKRFSISAAVLSFTFMGASFGLNISRKRRLYPIVLAIALTSLYLVSFFAAKGMDHRLWLTAILYLAPHVLIIAAALMILRRISKGIE